jgi:MATE family, multidrug efflux pump
MSHAGPTPEPGAAAPAVLAEIPSERRGVFGTLRDAVRGVTVDYTQIPIGRAIVLLAVPMVLEMGMESLFAITDIFWVARLGKEATAAVGVTESMFALVYAVAIGLVMGTTALVARRIGEKDAEGADRAAVQAIVLGLAAAIPIAIRVGSGFTRLLFGANATVMLLFVINAVFRAAGDASVALRVLIFANVINMVLDPLLIYGIGPFPALGVTGAAVATTIGRGSGVVLQLWLLARGRGRIRIRRDHLKLDPKALGILARLSGPAVLQYIINTASWTGVVYILGDFGTEAVAGNLVGIRIIVFGLLPSWGMSNAAATMVGQNLGAKRPDRAERSVWIAGFYNMIFLAVIGAVFVVFARPIVAAFLGDGAKAGAAELEYGTECLRTIACGYLFYAYGMVFGQAFNGAGDTWTPTWMNFGCFWLLELPLAWLLSHTFGMGPRGVFIAVAIAFSTLALVGGVLFRRGRWKARIV